MTTEEFIEKEESNVLKPYRCSEGFLTVGRGYNMDASPLPAHMAAYLKEHGQITEEMSLELFRGKVKESRAAAMGILGPVWTAMNEVRQAAVIAMVYQIGAKGFSAFHDTIKEIKAKRWGEAAYHALQSLWENQTEQRAHKTAIMLATGEWLRV